MATTKIKKRRRAAETPGIIPVVDAVNESALKLRTDMSRIMAILQNTSPGETPEQTLHRLRSVVGRISYLVRTSTQLVHSLCDLRELVDTMG